MSAAYGRASIDSPPSREGLDLRTAHESATHPAALPHTRPAVLPHTNPSELPHTRIVNVERRQVISRDEMNLAEFPITVLSTRTDRGVKTLEFRDEIRGKNGELVQREWIITGADKFGLPTSSDDEVLLGLLKLSVDDGLRDRKVYFTRYELLRILRWSTEGRNYSRLERALDRLTGVKIKATNAFYDNQSKQHSTRAFGVLDAYEINDGRESESKPSFFSWSEVMFSSFQAGFIKKLDLDFYLDLESAVSKRLYRFLDKHFWYRASVSINLFTLAHEKIGVSRTYKYASSLKQQLDPAFEELIRVGFLSGVEYLGKGTETDVVMYAAAGKGTSGGTKAVENQAGGPAKPSAGTATRAPHTEERAVSEAPAASDVPRVRDTTASRAQSTTCLEDEVSSSMERCARMLVERGIADTHARKLLRDRTAPDLLRIGAIIEHYDTLLRSRSSRVSRNPQGFLYRAVERFDSYVLPGEESRGVEGSATRGPETQQRLKLQGGSEQARRDSYDTSSTTIGARRPTVNRSAPPRAESASGAESAAAVSSERIAQYERYRESAVRSFKQSLAAEELAAMRAEIERSLATIAKSISSARLASVVEDCLDSRIASRDLELPVFEEWAKTH